MDYHLNRMEIIREYPPAEIAGKTIIGAIAGGLVSHDVKRYAHERGFYVLELTGETVALVPPPAGFVPRKWKCTANTGD